MRTAFCLAVIVLCTAVSAQSYTVTYGSGSFTPLGSGATRLSFTSDDELSTTLSFGGSGFDFFGTTYGKFEVCTNGFVLMDGGNTYKDSKPDLVASGGKVLAPRWADYAPSSGGYIAYEDQGGVMVVEWNDLKQASGSSGTITVTMQLIMDCNTGIIEFRYGSPSYVAQGGEKTEDYAVVIAQEYGIVQEVIFGDLEDSGITYVDKNTGIMIDWLEKSWIQFKPNGAANTPPTIAGSYQPNGTGPTFSITNGGTVNVAFGTTVSSMTFNFAIDDADSNNCAVSAAITNLGSTGIVLAQWQSSSAAVPYGLAPATGTFNTSAGVTHVVTLTVSDGTTQTVLSFSIVQSAASPVLAVADPGGAIAYNAAAGSTPRNFGTQGIAAGPTAAITITISNTGSAALTLSAPTATGSDGGEFVLNTSSMVFSVAPGNNTTFTIAFDPTTIGSKSSFIEFTHNAASSNPFRFEVTGVGNNPATPLPLIVVHEGTITGPVIANGAPATGGRDFGTLDLSAMPSAALTITIHNAGTADLTLGTPGSSSNQFTVDLTGFTGTVIAGGTTSFAVRFTATSTGLKGSTISFSHNDTSTTTPFSFGVTGTATITGTPQPGGNGGGGGGGGGGCAAAGGVLAPFALLLLAGLARRRRR
ncbi:MAG: choice-of-anchor D domain-containing protein [Planctomycetes bacterium]|nr:choice-of-anchor D domain-containing protein [Planctomycetota bacterium]